MIKKGLIAGAAALALLAGCTSAPAPRPAPAPLRPPPPPSPPPPPPAQEDWRDIALTPGDWRYGGDGSARFGAGGDGFTIRCDRAARQVLLAREGATGTMIVRTSEGSRNFASTSAALPVSDAFLDAIAFSRGRFTVEAAGVPMLVLPSWPEPSRVIEDCRD
jgi:hypothetical protein